MASSGLSTAAILMYEPWCSGAIQPAEIRFKEVFANHSDGTAVMLSGNLSCGQTSLARRTGEHLLHLINFNSFPIRYV